jgi:hypothetical protein
VPRADRARRIAVVASMVALFVLALAVFVLPFAFPTPPPIVTRFNATLLFSPDGDGRRDVAKINVRMHERGSVTIEIQREGETVRRILTDRAVERGWVREDFDGRDDAGRALPDGTYAIKLRARAGRKRFNTTRNIVIDTRAPRPAAMSVESAALGGPGEGECRVTLVSRDPGSVVLETRPASGGGPEPLRRLGARPVRADEPLRWAWAGRRSGGALVRPGLYLVRATLSDAARNRVVLERTCWVWYLIGRPVPARPSPGDLVAASLRSTAGEPLAPSTPVTLSLRRRTAVPGVSVGDALGARFGRAVRGPAGVVRVRVPPGIAPAALWLVVQTVDGDAIALIDLGGAR